MLSLTRLSTGALLLSTSYLAQAIQLNFDPAKHDGQSHSIPLSSSHCSHLIVSLTTAANIIAKDLIGYYTGSSGIGLFPSPTEWWESGAVWSAMVDYWQYTGDAQYVSLVQEALEAQAGPAGNFMDANQTKTEVCFTQSHGKDLRLTYLL